MSSRQNSCHGEAVCGRGHLRILAVRVFRLVRDKWAVIGYYRNESVQDIRVKPSELLSLRDQDINCEDMTVAISGKAERNKSRTLQLPGCVMVTFKNYVRNRNRTWPTLACKADPVLLRNRRGRPISPRSVRRKIAHYAQKPGLHPEISHGTLRATFTLRALRKGADAGTIQFLLGFEDMSSAESYVARFKSLLAAP